MAATNELEASKLKGRRVLDSRANTLGTVEDLLFDPVTWTVAGLVVELTKEAAHDVDAGRTLGREKRVAVTRERIGTVGDAVLLNVTADDLAALLRQAGPP